MEFPVYLELGPVAIHPHWVFEILAYVVGALIYRALRARQGDVIAATDRTSVIAAAAVGAAVGGKLLYWVSDPALAAHNFTDPFFLMAGKSIVGALVGALIAVEWTKRRQGITRRTGDLFAIPLAVGIGIGRIGCFLTGLEDHTHGIATSLPWAVDFGDGVLRHPTQLYETLFVWALVPVLIWLQRRPHAEGDLFRFFMVAYLGFRVPLELIKPGVPIFGLNAIQWVCLAVLAYYALPLARGLKRREVVLDG